MREMIERCFKLVLIGLLGLGLFGCGQRQQPKKIDLEKKEVLEQQEVSSTERPIRIAVGAMITPRAGFGYYKRFLEYIGQRLGRPVELVDRDSYAAINALLKSGQLDAAFVCSRPYTAGHDEFGLELLVVPQVYGETVYYSYIIVPLDSQVKDLEGLRGKTFAFTDPLSNTSCLVPTYMLAKMGEEPDVFFERYVYTYAHDRSIEMVARKIVDGAAVDSLVWEYANRTNPEFTSRTKVIRKSPPYGIPPVVVPKGLEPELKRRLREIFLSAHEDEKSKEILKGMMIDRFVMGDDSAYDSIRQMETWITQPN
jgi:phosphonate transport system substrate-binding protein